MKIKFGISSIIMAALCGTLPAAAQSAYDQTGAQPKGAQQLQEQTAPDQWQYGRVPLGKLERADKIIGREVMDSRNQKLGSVKDLAVEMKNGRLVEVIVGMGGMLGVDERYVAVPPEEFTCDPVNKTLVLNFDSMKFKEAPSFKLSEWKDNVGQARVGEVYNYYGAKPWFASANEVVQSRNAEWYQLGRVDRAGKVIGSPVYNVPNEKLGKVDDLMIDMKAGRVAEVILASGGFLGMGDELSAVPPESFNWRDHSALSLDTTKENLANAPHFKSSQWPEFNNADVMAVYTTYNVRPYFITSTADNTAQNANDRNALTPLNQGTSKDDIRITQEIRRQIMDAEGLSVNARNVKVITINGQVTLRGVVSSQTEKDQIDDIAKRVVSADRVTDQLQVERPQALNATPGTEGAVTQNSDKLQQ